MADNIKPRMDLSDSLHAIEKPRKQSPRRHPQEYIESEFSKAGYTLNDLYRGAHIPMHATCNAGCKIRISWTNLQSGRRCANCYRPPVTEETISQFLASIGCKFVGPYETARKKFPYLCQDGHLSHATWDAIRRSGRQTCEGCREESRAGRHGSNAKYDEAFISAQMAAENCKFIGPYETARKPFEYICAEGHRAWTTWTNFSRGKRCRECSGGGYDVTKKGVIYYVRFDIKGHSVWKIGITNKSTAHRFSGEIVAPNVIFEIAYDDGRIPPIKERKILQKYKEYRYCGEKFLSSGITECFSADVLQLDPLVNSGQLSLPLLA